MKIFNLLKKLFNVQSVDEISEEMIDNYYNETEKTEVVEETVEEEKTEEVVENAEPETTEEVKEEVVEEEVKEETPVEETLVEEEKIEETEEKKEDEVLTKEVINSSKSSVLETADLMNLHGDQFFNALYKNRKNLM